MTLKDYSTRVPAERTISEITGILAKNGACDILLQYGAGVVVAVNFAIETTAGKLVFQLPSDPEAVRLALSKEKRAGGARAISQVKSEDLEHARAVDWRIIKDWIEAQIAMIQKKDMRFEQVFLPYLVNPVTNKTLYQSLKEGNFKGLLVAGQEEAGGVRHG